jgi:hypothetical protein
MKLKDDKMIKYCLMAVEHINDDTVHCLECYYNKTKNYENMIKYYLMVIECNNSNSMNNLGTYHEEIQNYNEMKNIV